MNVDVLIVGGGIAGLWLLAELRASGINALLATDALGKGQTIASQGIIHGGTKYALTGKLTRATLAIGDMPHLWRNALNGAARVDLRRVNILTESQLLWTSGGVGARLTGFFASKAMKSRMEAVPRKDYPALFQNAAFHGGLYRLAEPVLDVPSLLAVLREQLAAALMQVDIKQSGLQAMGDKFAYRAVLPDGETLLIEAGQIILTAGAGNDALLAPVQPRPEMQRRPLQMVMMRGDLPMIYAHALGMSDKPRATITSHQDAQGKTLWYIGGQPAEQGAGQSPSEVIAATRHELAELLPWVDFSDTEWATWHVDRAEACQADGSRPDQPVFMRTANVTVAWPTKLAFAPMLATRLLETLPFTRGEGKLPSYLPTPPIATPIWDQVTWNRY